MTNPVFYPDDATSSPKRSPGRPRKEDLPQDGGTAQMIVQHAKRLFMQSGYAAVSISAIVESVGITKPTLYYYFVDKEALYSAVLIDMLQRGGQYIAMALDVSEGKGIRATLMYLATGFFQNAPTSIAMLMRDAGEHLDEARLGPVLEAHTTYIISPFITLLENAMERGEIRRQDATTLAFVVVGLLDSMMVSFSMAFSRRFAYEKLAETTIDSLFEGLRQR